MSHFKMNTRAWLACGSAAVALLSAQPAFAQDSETPAAEEAEEGSTILVLGTRRTDRTSTTSPSPVDVISAAELTSQPAANIIDSVKNIVPSFFVGQNTISDASTFVRSPSLRGLSGDQVLVMVNGKRYNRSALVQVYGGSDTGLGRGAQGPDISAIPSLAIGNLQVLREGATAQYGSDAIAGVLNFGLKEDAGFEIVGRVGEFYAGDGRSYQIAGNAGFAGDWGFVNLTGEYYDDAQTSRGKTRPSAFNFANNFPALASQLPNFPDPVQIWGSSPTDGYKAVLNAAFNVTDNSKVYLFANYAKLSGNQSFNYRPSVSSTAVDSNGVVRNQGANPLFNNTFYLTPCPASTPTCPSTGFVTGGATFRFSTLYPAGFTPRFVGETEQMYGVLGFKGEMGELNYDLSGTLAKNMLTLSMYDSLNASFGPLTQTSFEFGDLIQEEFNLNLDLSYAMEVGFASPLTISGGAEFRKETYEQTAGDAQSYSAGPYAVAQQLFTLVTPAVGATPAVYAAAGTSNQQGVGASGYAGTSPTTAGAFSQENYGVYIGLETDITDALTVGAAGRYERYNTFGSAWVGKVNALYKISDAISVRGSIGTGYHAPSPGQSNVAIVTTSFAAGVAFQAGTYPTTSEIAQFYGATELTPEKSTNYGLGLILRPADKFTITVDGYQIDLKDRIGLRSAIVVTAADVLAQPALNAVGVNGQVQYFTNGFDTRTKGVDVVATYRATLTEADLSFSLAYNYNKTDITKFDPNVISLAQRIDAANLAPKHRVVFNANWSLGGLSLNVRENYYGSFTSAQDYGVTVTAPATATTPAQGFANQTFGDKFTTDLELSYSFNDNYTLSIGALNFTDEKPDRLKATSTVQLYPVTGGTLDGQVYPRAGGPFGVNGGFYYAKFRIKY